MVVPRTLLGSAQLRDRLARIVGNVGGQRAFSRLTGIPRSTLQDFLSGRVETPTSLTLGRLTQPVRDEGIRTVRFDAAEFTTDTLSRLQPPPGSNAFRIVSERLASPGREFGSSEWMAADDLTPEEAIEAMGLDPAAITRVVFNKP